MDPFLGEICLFATAYIPRGWVECDGRLLAIPQYPALFNVIGTLYGGDGVHNFAVPDLRGRAARGARGGGQTGSDPVGTVTGTATQALTHAQIPPHGHAVSTYSVATDGQLTGVPSSKAFLSRYKVKDSTSIAEHFGPKSLPLDVSLHASTISTAGESQPHENRQPFLTMRYGISVEGIYPTRG